MSGKFPINPRFRAYGKARIDIARRARTRRDWDTLWKEPVNPFPFRWGEHWKQCIEYRVDDYAAEVGFFIDILGLPVNAFDERYAQFTGPGGEFYFAVVPVNEGETSTPVEALRMQFMVADLQKTVAELEARGVVMEIKPQPCAPDSALHIASFRTPHGIAVDLWGKLLESRKVERPAAAGQPQAGQPQAGHPQVVQARQSDRV